MVENHALLKIKMGEGTVMEKRTSNTSLATRTAAVVIAFIVICSIVTGIISYVIYRRDSIEMSAQRAEAVAAIIAGVIDPAGYREAMDSGERTPYWQELKGYLDQARRDVDMLYLYVMDADYSAEEAVYFISGVGPDETDDAELWDTDSLDAFAPEMYRSLARGISTQTGIYMSEGYGLMVSGFAPVFNE